MSQVPPGRILIVEDHHVMQLGLRGLLGRQADLTIVGHAETADEAVASYQALRPDLVLMDLRLRQGHGVDAMVRIRHIAPGARVLVYSSYDGEEDLRRACLAGASGYVLKDSEGDELLRAVRQVLAGERFFPERVQSGLEQGLGGPRLSPREQEILWLLHKGLINREIAAILSLTRGSVRIYISRILKKLDVSNRTEAVSAAFTRGLLHSHPGRSPHHTHALPGTPHELRNPDEYPASGPRTLP